MRPFAWQPLLASVCVPLLAAGVAMSQDDPAGDSPQTSRLQEIINATPGWFELAGGADEHPLKAVPVLRWDNNSRGSATGLTVLYVGDGRPEAVCCVYPWEENLIHEFGSLARGPLVGRRDGETFWSPDEAGPQFAAIPKAEAPAGARPARMRQMKMLTDRFAARLVGWKGDNSDAQDLRLMPRPLYRYEEGSGDVFDGAVFSYAMGTDPEVLLLIEAVRVGEKSEWQYAFARRTSGELRGSLDGEAVWSAERYPVTSDPKRADRSVYTPLAELGGAAAGER